ncbi:MAG: hypothetical protein WC503_04165 [Candidatus Shapirobacteria bacterium]
MATFKETVNYDPTFQLIYEGMTTWEIGEKLGLSHVYVGKVINKCLGRIYKAIRDETKESPFAVAIIMQKSLNIGESQEDINTFMNSFPKDIKKAIEEDAKKRIGSLQKKPK